MKKPKPSVTIPRGATVDLSELVDEWEVFLNGLRRGSSVSEAAKGAGMSSSRAYKRRNDDAEFAERWAQAVDDGTDVLEDEAFRRATTGKSDYLLSMLLKARRPNVYGERVAVDVKHTISWEPMSKDEWIETYGPAPKVIEHEEEE